MVKTDSFSQGGPVSPEHVTALVVPVGSAPRRLVKPSAGRGGPAALAPRAACGGGVSGW